LIRATTPFDVAKMQPPGEAEKESPGMLPVAVTAEAPTACGDGGMPAPAAVRPRRETTGSGYGSALPKPKKASAVKKAAAREAAATSAATAIVEAARTAETTQVDSGATALLAAAAVLVSPQPSSQTQPLPPLPPLPLSVPAALVLPDPCLLQATTQLSEDMPDIPLQSWRSRASKATGPKVYSCPGVLIVYVYSCIWTHGDCILPVVCLAVSETPP